MKRILKRVLIITIIGIIALAGFLVYYKPTLVTSFFQKDEESRDLYKTALEHLKKEDYKSSYYTFGLISPKYNIYDMVLFHQARCASEIEDESTAIRKYLGILAVYPESPIASQANYALGQALIRQGNISAAEKQFVKTIKNYPGTDYATGSFYYLGSINKDKNTEIAGQYWLKYIALAPGGTFALESIKGLESISYEFSQKDKKLAAIALYFSRQYKDALRYLNQISFQDSWYYKARCYESLGDKNNAVYYYREGIKKHSDKISRSKLQQAMLSYVRLNYQRNYDDWSNLAGWTKKSKDYALYHKAQLLSTGKAKKLYEEIYKNYPRGKFASDALWNLFWNEINRKNYKKAIELGEKHIETYVNTRAAPAVYFWMGKIYETKNNIQKAKGFYKTVLSKFPDSYYAFRASGRLEKITKGSDCGWVTCFTNKLPDIADIPLPYTYNQIAQKHGHQAAELLYLGDYETALSFMKKDSFLESWVKLQNGQITSSIVSAKNEMNSILDKPASDDIRWKLIYPVYYPEKINSFSEKNSLDPLIVVSLMREESHFNPHAVSCANARGLMQILPTTAKDIARWKSLGRYSNQDLFRPEVNIKLGTAYLKYVKDTLRDDMMLAVAAYNGGPAAVQKWLNKYPNEDFDRFIEKIPYQQTRNYVKKVYRSYWNYNRVYGTN